jgi:hypothetical protein
MSDRQRRLVLSTTTASASGRRLSKAGKVIDNVMGVANKVMDKAGQVAKAMGDLAKKAGDTISSALGKVMTKAKGLASNFSPADLENKLKGKLNDLLMKSPKLANALNKATDFTHGLMADLMSDAMFSAAIDMLGNYADSNILMSAMLILGSSGSGNKKDSTNPQKKKKKKSKTDKEKKERKPREFKERVINEDGTKTYTLTSKKNGKDYTVTYDKAGYPIFNSKFDTNIPESHYLVSDRKQFKHLTLELAKEIEKNSALAGSLTEKELALIKKGKVPSTLTWHHHQETDKMQLVDYYEHEVAKHTGGRSIWGGGRKGREGKL